MNKLILIVILICFQHANAGENMSFVQYGKKHTEVVESEINSIISNYEENSLREKEHYCYVWIGIWIPIINMI